MRVLRLRKSRVRPYVGDTVALATIPYTVAAAGSTSPAPAPAPIGAVAGTVAGKTPFVGTGFYFDFSAWHVTVSTEVGLPTTLSQDPVINRLAEIYPTASFFEKID